MANLKRFAVKVMPSNLLIRQLTRKTWGIIYNTPRYKKFRTNSINLILPNSTTEIKPIPMSHHKKAFPATNFTEQPQIKSDRRYQDKIYPITLSRDPYSTIGKQNAKAP